MNFEDSQPVHSSNFCIEHFQKHGVWTWNQDLHASEDSLVPVPITEEGLSDAGTLVIYSRLTTASLKTLEGAVFYQLGGEVFAIEIFVQDESFTFNKHLPDMAMESLQKLASTLGDKTEKLLPIQYSVIPEELLIEDGKFDF